MVRVQFGKKGRDTGQAGNGPPLNRGLSGDFAVKYCRTGGQPVTKDGSLAAHFEHSIAITERGRRYFHYWRSLFSDRRKTVIYVKRRSD
jgi:hypothetical protein